MLGAAVGHVPRMSMGRARWEVPVAEGGGDGGMVAGVRQLTPEAREVASRTYVAGVPGSSLLHICMAAGRARPHTLCC